MSLAMIHFAIWQGHNFYGTAVCTVLPPKDMLHVLCCHPCFLYRYEPCGLVDIEFGWYGSLIIGHETGGLGKMPGFYFKSGMLQAVWQSMEVDAFLPVGCCLLADAL
jgi:hypothetical protein